MFPIVQEGILKEFLSSYQELHYFIGGLAVGFLIGFLWCSLWVLWLFSRF